MSPEQQEELMQQIFAMQMQMGTRMCFSGVYSRVCVCACSQITRQLPRDMHAPCVLTDGAASMPPGMMGMPPGMMGPGSKRYTWCCV